MKIRADEHISPVIVHAIRDIALRHGWEISSIHDVGDDGTEDEYWITAFARNGGDAILTADKDFQTKLPQVEAVRGNGLRVIHLPRKWAQATGRIQAANLLLWWERIEEALEEMPPGDCRRPTWSERDSGPLKPVVLNLPRVRRQHRKAGR